MKLKNLTSTGFILGLTTLLLNDFYLKSHYGNWLTGKLSDFAGLFIFPLFWTILLPKYKDKIYFITALFFIYWKSSYSNPLIELINQYSLINLSRTIDLTDLTALLILPVSYFYEKTKRKNFVTINPKIILVLSSFVFIATSYVTKVDYEKTYAFDYSLDILKTKIYQLPIGDNQFQRDYQLYVLDSSGKYKIHQYRHDTIDVAVSPIDAIIKDTLTLYFSDETCFRGYDTQLKLSGDNKKSMIKVNGFSSSCNDVNKSTLIKSFESNVIDKLK